MHEEQLSVPDVFQLIASPKRYAGLRKISQDGSPVAVFQWREEDDDNLHEVCVPVGVFQSAVRVLETRGPRFIGPGMSPEERVEVSGNEKVAIEADKWRAIRRDGLKRL